MGKPAKKMYNDQPRLVLDDALAETIQEGVTTVFQKSFNLKVESGTYEIFDNYSGTGDISGTVGMVQEVMEGGLTVSFPEPTILKIISELYGQHFDVLNDSVRDSVGEVTNIVFGLVKKNLNDRGFNFKMAIPNIVVGKQHRVYPIHQGQTMMIPFSTKGLPFEVFVTVQKNLK